MSNLLVKDVKFKFDQECLEDFKLFKHKLSSTPIITPLDWSSNFEMMCDASDYAVGAVLGQWKENKFHVIIYPSKVLSKANSLGHWLGPFLLFVFVFN